MSYRAELETHFRRAENDPRRNDASMNYRSVPPASRPSDSSKLAGLIVVMLFIAIGLVATAIRYMITH